MKKKKILVSLASISPCIKTDTGKSFFDADLRLLEVSPEAYKLMKIVKNNPKILLGK